MVCLLLTFNEIRAFWHGTESHHFSVERGVGQELQLNLDIVVAMPCHDLHVNIQDGAMDRILAGDLLTKDDTNWQTWLDRPVRRRRSEYRPSGGNEAYASLHAEDASRKTAEQEDQHVSHVLGHMREGGRKFVKTPRLRRGEAVNACRIYGSLEGNKVQGDFHITARGHGYLEFGHQQHLDHSLFNFSHHINELSFGPHYPSLLNPLDKTSATTDVNFYKYQYYLSIVPTIFTRRSVTTKSGSLDPAAIPQPATLDLQPDHTSKNEHGIVKHIPNPQAGRDTSSVFTNQYAATSQSREVPNHVVPGIFFKYDIEPILLIISESRGSLLGLIVRLVNVVSGVLVAGGWTYQLSGWLSENFANRRRRNTGGLGNGALIS